MPNDCGVLQAWSRMVVACPVLSTTAQREGAGHDTARLRDPAWPGPGSDGLAGSGGGVPTAAGSDQLVPSPVLARPEPSTITQRGPDVQVTVGSTGAVTVPEAGAGKYTDGEVQVAPSQDMVTPEPASRSLGSPVVPPPAATQSVSEMQASEVKPPPGGRMVRGAAQPGACGTVVGTVVGVADGTVVEVVDGLAPVVEGAVRRSAVGVADEEEQSVATTTRMRRESAASSRLGSTCPLTRARLGCRIGSGTQAIG